MPIDPSWFFSTLAQTSGAIIGLIGAILITILYKKIDSNRNLRDNLIELFRAIRSHVNIGLQNILPKIGFMKLQITKYEGMLKQGIKEVYIDVQYSVYTGVIQMHKKYTLDQNFIDEQKREIIIVEKQVDYLRKLLSLKNLEEYGKEYSANQADPRAREINQFIGSKSYGIFEMYSRFKKIVFPKHIVILIISLIWLTVFSVGLPLCFLYVEPIIKIVLLCLFACGMGILVWFFISQIKGIIKISNKNIDISSIDDLH